VRLNCGTHQLQRRSRTGVGHLLRAVEGHPRILPRAGTVSRLMQFSDHGMDLELRFWIADPEGGVNNVRSDVNRLIWRLFRESKITIPWHARGSSSGTNRRRYEWGASDS